MKIVKLITAQNVDVGGRQGVTHLMPGTPAAPKGLKLDSIEHPTLGDVIAVQTDDLVAKNQVSFVFTTNIVNLVVENDEPAPAKKGK